jgi:hypothetical protein
VAAGANTDPVIRVTENGLELVISNPSDTRRTYPTMWRESLFSSSPPHLRASELGVLPISRREAHLSIRAGTVVIADAFDLNEETSQVIATGDAIVEVWRESDVVARVTANRVTIGEPTR